MKFYIFLLINALFCIALYGSRPIVSIYANDQGVSVLIIGILVSSFAFFPMFVSIQVGKLLDRLGAQKVALMGGCGMMIALLLPVLKPTIFVLFLSQLLLGISHTSFLVSMQKTVGNLPGNRDKLIAALSLSIATGEMLGPLLSGFSYDHWGFRNSYLLFFILSATALIIAVGLRSDHWKSGKPTRKESTGGSKWDVLKNRNLCKAIIVGGLVLYSKDLFIAYFPVYGSDIGMSASTIGMILALSAGMAMGVRVIQFHLVQWFGRANVLTGTILLSGAAYLGIPFFEHSIILALLACLIGAGLGLGSPLSLVYAMNLSPEDRQGEILGLRLAFNKGSQFAGPLVFGGIGGVMGLLPIFWVSGVVLLLAAYYTRMGAEGHSPKEVNTQEKESAL